MSTAHQMQGVSLRSLYKRSPGHVAFTMDPVRDLLIWAIVQNRRELAEIIWAQVTGAVSQHAWLRVGQRRGSSQGGSVARKPSANGRWKRRARGLAGAPWASVTPGGAPGAQRAWLRQENFQ